MRSKMRRALDKSNASSFDLKQGTGGIADIEFLVQYLILAHAKDDPRLIEYTDNIRQLDALADTSLMSRADCDALQSVYRAYREVTHRLSLDQRPAYVDPERFADERGFVGGWWKKTFDAG